jgi:uracil-DNA glycosylase
VLLVDPGGGRPLNLVGCYHPSQRNMSTRTLTPAMLRDVLRRGADLAEIPARPHSGRAGT